MKIEDFDTGSGRVVDRIATALTKVSLALRHRLRSAAQRQGLSAIQAQVLVQLARRGPMEVSALCRVLAMSASTISESVSALEARNLVHRQTDPRDHRKVLIQASPRGRRLGQSLTLWTDEILDALEGLSEQERRVFLKALFRMILVLLANGVIQEARMCLTCAEFRPNVHDDPERPHHCALVDMPLGLGNIRVECDDHRSSPRETPSFEEVVRWL